MPKKAPEEPKPLSFVIPNPWSALPREVYVGKGRGKKEGATTESPVDGQDQPRIYTIRDHTIEVLMHPDVEAGSDPRGHLGVTWGVYLCAGKPPLADIILSHPPDLTRCDSVIGLAIPAMSGHIQNRGATSGDLYIGISGINRVLLS